MYQFFYFCRTYWYWSVSCFWYCLWTSHDFYSKVCLTWFNLCSCISFGTSFLDNVQVSYNTQILLYRYCTFALIFHAGLMQLSGEEWPAGGILEDFFVSYIFISVWSCVLNERLYHGFFYGTRSNIQQLLLNMCTSVDISHVWDGLEFSN